MDLVTASQVRLPLAVELLSGDVHLPCEIIRLSNGRIVWCEFARLIDIQHARYSGTSPIGSLSRAWTVSCPLHLVKVSETNRDPVLQNPATIGPNSPRRVLPDRPSAANVREETGPRLRPGAPQ